ncbi:MAG: HEAT repeat domain-containing protein [Candidatus Latescibacterota bacterium]|nr:HEAT repeat domain-containing protein [Candidatus Latescibacterota bacterium]
MTARLLNDDRMQEFIKNGYITLQTDLPADFHRDIYQHIEEVFANEGNPGNNVLPRVPAIQRVLDDAVVHGALQSILGPGYYHHPHRHCHFNPPQSDGQRLHKDSWSKRHHRVRWAMAFYYPQDTPTDLGPTGIVPGSQYHNAAPDANLPGEVPLTGNAGTVVLVHYDLWHRAMPNTSADKRYMVKFLFTRLDEPTGPTWDTAGGDWPADDDPRRAMWQSQWNWHKGANGKPINGGTIDALRDTREAPCLQTAYHLDEQAIPALVDLLADEDETVRRNAGYALTAIGKAAVPALVKACGDARHTLRAQAADALGDIGATAAAAAPTLVGMLADAAEEIRRNAADALGVIGGDDPDTAAALAPGLTDADEWVRRNTALALLRLGPGASPAQTALVTALDSDNRYVSAKAAQTLKRINTPEAQEALLDHLFTARWCPLTSAASRY